MKVVKAMQQALAGMQNVEREIVSFVRGRGAPLEAANFSWNRGKSVAELPASVHMEVKAGTKKATADWARIQLEDSWERIESRRRASGNRAYRRDARAGAHQAI